jgi:hypothetical protein
MSGDELERELSQSLRRVVDEARATRPEVDWDALEARLFDESGELRPEHQTPATRLTPRFVLVAALGLAAAAAIAGFFALPKDHGGAGKSAVAPPTTTQVVAATATTAKPARPAMMLLGGDHEARELHVGDVIEVAAAEGEWIQSQGRLRAHAAAGSKLRLLDDGDRMRFALDKGEITADVTPVPGGEPYAIDVDGRRVAVHGTQLTVARVDGAVEVAVSEGVAAIGVPGEGRTSGPAVNAGMIGRFVGAAAPELRTDPIEAARRVTRGLAPRAAAVPTVAIAPTLAIAPPATGAPKPATTLAPSTAPVANAATTATTTTAPVATTAIAPAPGLSPAEYGPALGRVESAVKGCVPRTTAGITFTIESTMTLVIGKDGAIESMSFDPALSPQLRSCVQSGTASIKFPAAAGSTTVSRDVTLGSAR